MATASTKTLIIAEKPSVALDIVKSIPEKFSNESNYYESPSYIVSFALGHLVTICNPKEMDERHKSWSLDNLPIIPDEFTLKALPKTKGQLSTLAKLIKRKEVGRIVNACDAGREGELIFRYILQYTLGGKPPKAQVSRLWLQSMTKAAIEEGLRHLRAEEEMRKLAAAATSRAEADWLVGINGSRALTGYKSLHGGFFLTPCGRVQTPTLSMLVQREREREAFRPRDFWELHATFAFKAADGSEAEYAGRWFDPKFKKREDDEHGRADRLWDEARARAIADKCRGKAAEVTETQKPSSQVAPQLYDLTTLQREANARFGFSAKNTLGLAQALYERHKALTYPRTDSRHLPEDYAATVQGVLRMFQGGEYGRFATQVLENKWVRPDPRVFDNKKISDHFAIIPTAVAPGALSEPERRVYQMVAQRFLAVFFPPARFLNTSRISVVEGESFRTEGKVLEEPGWKVVYGVDRKEEEILAPWVPGIPVRNRDITVKADATRPPPRFTESTLLSYMESAGKYLEDEELADAMKERGLGTPATRAAIIEGLIEDKYVVREGKELVPTAKGLDLLLMLSAIGIDELVSPELTGEWEWKLNRIERGLYTRDEFMQEIRKLTRRIVEKIKAFDEDKDSKTVAFQSPIDGQDVFETLSKYETADGKLRIRKMMGGRQMSRDEVIELMAKRQIGPLTGFRSKAGKPFSAAIKLTAENKVEFVFSDNLGGEDGQAPDFTGQEPVGVSPVDGTKVFETLAAYVSESAAKGDQKNGLKVNKVILGKAIERENMARMLRGEKTELIKGFQSSKTRRFFDAYLKMAKDGKIQFEFPPREFKGRGRGKAAAKDPGTDQG